MTLSDRAQEFIKSGRPADQIRLLSDCVRAHNLDGLSATQKLYEDMYGNFSLNYELKVPAAACLICWGDEGVNALVEGAMRTRTAKNWSITVQMLSALAARAVPRLFMTRLNPELRERIVQTVRDNPDLQNLSRQRLTEFILSLPDDDEVSLVASTVFMHLAFDEDSQMARELSAALASRWSVIGKPVIGRYRDLITNYRDDESKFQAFFESFPQLLDPLAIQVWPRPNLHGAEQPDFVVKRADGTYLLVEIETAAKPLVTGTRQITAQVTQAIAQVTRYRSFLMERFQEASAHFPDFRDPDCLVVIGLERILSVEQRQALAVENADRARVRVVGFDWIADRTETILLNMISINIAARPLRMT